MNTICKKNIGIVCAVDEEFASLTQHLQYSQYSCLGEKQLAQGMLGNISIVIIQSGIGNINAAIATTSVINQFNPSYLFFSGIAGALNPALNVGDVLVGKTVFQAEAITHEKLRVTWDMPELEKHSDQKLLMHAESLYEQCTFSVKSGVIVSSDIYPAPKDFQQLFEEKSAEAIDMESAGFYQACQAFSVPCLSIRSFSNSVTCSENEILKHELIDVSSSNSSNFCFRLIKHISRLHKIEVVELGGDF